MRLLSAYTNFIKAYDLEQKDVPLIKLMPTSDTSSADFGMHALSKGDLIMDGDPSLTRNVSAWLRPSIFVNSPRDAVVV